MSDGFRFLPPSEPINYAGRFYYTSNDGAFTAEQYADMAATRLIADSSRFSKFMQAQICEDEAYVKRVLTKYFAEAIADGRRQVGNRYENGQVDKARLLLPGSYLAPPSGANEHA